MGYVMLCYVIAMLCYCYVIAMLCYATAPKETFKDVLTARLRNNLMSRFISFRLVFER